MASSAAQKSIDAIGANAQGQDSAIHLQDSVAESSQPRIPTPTAQPTAPGGPGPDGAIPHPGDNDNHNDDDDHNHNHNHNHAQDIDSDSAFDSGSLSGDETDTLASTVLHYRIENGRQYHAYQDGAYWGPNDEQAKEILDFTHHLYLLTLDQKLYLAPIQNPQTILDCGTGTGIWAMDMADKHPSATVTGIDLSPIQPEWVPPNCHFQIDDITLPWTFPLAHFDFIHIRELFGSVPDWDVFLSTAYSHTKPGGWIEVVEHAVYPSCDDDSMPSDHFYHTWGRTTIEMGEKFGKTFNVCEGSAERLRNAGFVDVTVQEFKWPVNGWPKEEKLKNLGKWNQSRLADGVEGFMLRLLTQVGGWSVLRAQLYLAQMRREVKNLHVHAYQSGTVVYGRRPPAPQSTV